MSPVPRPKSPQRRWVSSWPPNGRFSRIFRRFQLDPPKGSTRSTHQKDFDLTLLQQLETKGRIPCHLVTLVLVRGCRLRLLPKIRGVESTITFARKAEVIKLDAETTQGSPGSHAAPLDSLACFSKITCPF